MKFDYNEYVWDRVWDGPAIVLRVNPKAVRPYVVAEITHQHKRLNRMATRFEDQLCRFVNVKLPEDEALVLIYEVPRSDQEHLIQGGEDRIREQLKRRGVLVPE